MATSHSCAQTTNCAPPASGLVSWWAAQDNADDTLGNINSGLHGGVAYASGQVGRAFEFDGFSGSVTNSTWGLTNIVDSYTMEFWAWPTAGRASTSENTLGTAGHGNQRYAIFPYSGPTDGIVGAGVSVGTNGVSVVEHGPAYLPTLLVHDTSLNGWTHIAVVYMNRQPTLYLNGVFVKAGLTSLNPSCPSTWLGERGAVNYNQGFYAGRLDEVSIYNRPLSAAEIQSIYAAGSAGKCPPSSPPEPPSITQHPQSRTVNANATAQFTVAANGSPTLRYQWFFGSNPLAGATNTALTIPIALPANAGTYFVTVSNDFGFVISSNATLTVLTFPPVITRQPTNVTAFETTAASLSVQATGSVTLAYQWLYNNQPLAGRTAATLSFTSVQSSNTGNYSVIVTNPYGAVTSSVAVLTVNPRPPCASVHDGLVSWWKGEDNFLDNWDSNNGSIIGALRNAAGKVARSVWYTGAGYVNVPDSPSLRTTNGITLEAWVFPDSSFTTVPSIIASKYVYPLSQPPGTQNCYLLGTTNSGRLFFTLSPNGTTASNATVQATNTLPLNKWTHIAATYNGSVIRLYINGVQVAQTNHTGGIFPGNANLNIAAIQTGSTSFTWGFGGLIDELSLYNRALSAAEIQSIVAADLTGKCLAPPVITQQPQDKIIPLGEDVKFTVGVSGSRPLTYQWYFNGATSRDKITGATNSTLLIEKVRTNNAGLYFVAVTNSLGFATSARATLSTLPAPSCTDILPGLISWWKADGSTLDVMGLNNAASYSPGTYPTGKVNTAFTFNGINSRVSVNTSSSLDFTNNQNFSIETWIKATTTNGANSNVPLLEKRHTLTTGWWGYSLSLYNGQLAFALGAPKTPAGATTNQLFVSSSQDLRDSFFHHVAVTLNRTAGNGGVLYVDGSPVMVFDPRAFTNALFNQAPLYIGGPATTVSNSYYTGLIDEPAIYGRPLSSAEVLSIYTAGASGRCTAPPVIITQPVGTFVNAGSNYTLSVVASGIPAPRYQWRRNTAPVANATNSTLAFTNITAASTGTYSVVVSNGIGTVTSSNAVVTVITNRPPTVLSGTTTVAEDGELVFTLQGFDPDGNNLSYTVTSFPTNGTITGISRFWTYRPAHDFNGLDSLTFKVNDGFVDSAPGTITFVVNPVNDAPVAFSEQFAMDEDSTLPIQLRADDVDSDKLAFEIVQQPAHGVLTGAGPKRIYTPAQDYFGDDYFTFIARDDSNAVSQIAVVIITVRAVNDAPVAKIILSPLDELPGVTNTVLIAPACCDATLLLDGSQSTDVENDPLTYIWLNGTNVLATTATFTNYFRSGTYEITLIVSDGLTAATKTAILEIITPSEAVTFLKSLVEESITERKQRVPLVNWLRQADESFEKCHIEQGMRFLALFQQRVVERIAPTKPEFAKQLVDTAQAIIDAAPDCEPCHRIGRSHHGHGKDKDDHRDGERAEDNGDKNESKRERESERVEKSSERDSPDIRVGKSSPR